MDSEQLQQLGLKPITAFVPTDGSKAKRGKSAERMQRMRERKKAEGLVNVEMSSDQADSLEEDLAIAAKLKSLNGLRRMLVMLLLVTVTSQ